MSKLSKEVLTDVQWQFVHRFTPPAKGMGIRSIGAFLIATGLPLAAATAIISADRGGAGWTHSAATFGIISEICIDIGGLVVFSVLAIIGLAVSMTDGEEVNWKFAKGMLFSFRDKTISARIRSYLNRLINIAFVSALVYAGHPWIAFWVVGILAMTWLMYMFSLGGGLATLKKIKRLPPDGWTGDEVEPAKAIGTESGHAYQKN